MIKIVDNKFINYTEETKKQIKYSLIFKQFLGEIKQMKKNFSVKIDSIKEKNYSAENLKNKNLLNLSIEEEIKNPAFKQYIIERINREGKLNNSLKEKAYNDKLISSNATQIKRDEKVLLEKYYCVLCHKLPRNILIKNCNHLVMCDNCVKTIQICPRCGIDIEGYDKIFR